MISHHAEPGMEGPKQEGRIVEALTPQKLIPRRRGRPKKNKEDGETRILDEPHARSFAENSLMPIVHLKLLEGKR